MSAELVTVPPAGVPRVLTLIGPDGCGRATSSGHRPPKIVAGPYLAWAPSGSVADCGLFEPSDARVTEGLLVLSLAGANGWPACGSHPSFDCGPPKRPALMK